MILKFGKPIFKQLLQEQKVDINPFDVKLIKIVKKEDEEYKILSNKDIEKLLIENTDYIFYQDTKRNLKTFEDVKNVIKFGLYAGMRIDSILNLKIENVKDNMINILQDKTSNGTRFIPVHSKLKNIITEKNNEKRDNDYLFFGKRRSKISEFVNKYMQHTLQDKMKRHRSLRKNFITALDNNFPENVNYRRWLSGHSLAGVDNKNYIKNRDITTLTKMIDSISY